MEQEGALVLVSAGPVTATATPKRAVAPPTSLAPGFRFHPTDEELVRYYLRRKACGKPFRFQAVSEIDVYKSEPWELAEYSSLKTRDLEWYFFSPVDRKYGNGSRLNRATGKGYWKATGKDRPVRHKSQTNGMKKTLVFHSGRAPDGKRTNWVMHEYRLTDEELERAGVVQDAFVLCRIFQKSGLGPPNGDRYAPFIEEEWDDDTALLVPGEEAEDDVANGDEARVEGNDLDQDVLAKAPRQSENLLEPRTLSFVCKRERSEEPEPLSLAQSKRSKHDDPSSSLSLAYSKRSMHEDPSSSLSLAQSKKSTHDEPSSSLSLAQSKKSTHDDPSSSLSLAQSKRSTHDDPSSSLSLAHSRRSMHDDPSSSLSLAQSKRSNHDDPSSSHANGSEDSTTSQQDPPTKMMTTNYSPTLLAFPLLEPLEPKESQPSNTLTFDSSNLEKSVPPGYLKFISNLENEILNVSMERETAKIEVMRAQAMINILKSRIDLLNKENEDLRRHVRGG